MIEVLLKLMAKQQRQSSFPGFSPRTEHGGELRAGKRKIERPIDPERALHVTLRSTRASGRLSLLSRTHVRQIEILRDRYARRFQVRVYRYANVGNHLHLAVKGKTREGIQNFFRAFSGGVARLVTQAKKGQAFGKFWDALIYTKVIEWGTQFKNTLDYVFMNQLEAAGVWHRSLGKPPRAGPAHPLLL